MRPGPPKTPTALAEVRGRPGRRPPPLDEPKPALATSEPPQELTGAPLAIWRARVPSLVAVGLIAQADVLHVRRACELEAEADALWSQVRGATVTASRLGERRQAQELANALALFEAADRIWYRFGITPSERARVKGAGDPEPNDPLAKRLRERPKVPRIQSA